MCCPKRIFETNPLPLECFHAIPFVNGQSKLACPVKNNIRDIHVLVLCIQHSVSIGELENFFDGGEYGFGWILKMVSCLLDGTCLVSTECSFIGGDLTLPPRCN